MSAPRGATAEGTDEEARRAGATVERVERLRMEFDQTFARAVSAGEAAREAVLAVRVRDDRYAVRLKEIGGLHADRPVTRLPGPFPALLGLAGFRGAIVPVFDLGALLGYPPAPPGRWLLLTAGAAPVGLAFDRFEHTEFLSPEAVDARPVTGRDASAHARPLARTADGPRPLVDVPSLLTAIDGRIRKPG